MQVEGRRNWKNAPAIYAAAGGRSETSEIAANETRCERTHEHVGRASAQVER